jgi:hypothetical protein
MGGDIAAGSVLRMRECSCASILPYRGRAVTQAGTDLCVKVDSFVVVEVERRIDDCVGACRNRNEPNSKVERRARGVSL